MNSSNHSIFFPKLRTNSLKLESDYSPEFKSIYENAVDVLERKYKRLSERRIMSIGTIEKTERKLKRSEGKERGWGMGKEMLSVVLRVPRIEDGRYTAMETRNASLTSPGLKTRSEKEEGRVKEMAEVKKRREVSSSGHKRFFRIKNQ